MNIRTLTVLLGAGALLAACNGGDKADDTGQLTDDTGDTDTDDPVDDTGDTGPEDADGDGFDADVDCDDDDAQINPDATEVCDGLDNDCDELVDEDDDDLDLDTMTSYYNDADGDGYGDPEVGTDSCADPGGGFVLDNTDCDDDNAANFPGTVEACDDVDNDCDGVVDDVDVDGDGYFDSTCLGGDDCDDGVPEINPGADEVCDDGIDNNCDGFAGECTYSGDIPLSDADAIFRGEAASDRAGQGDPGLASGGDLDGDGFDDIVVGAIRNDESGDNAGAAYIVYGAPSGEMNLSAADVKITGADDGDFLGRAVNGVGDADGDGQDDLVISALYGGTNDGGAAYLLHGPLTGDMSVSVADLVVSAETADDLLADVEPLGDINGDSLADLLVGAQYNADGGTDAGRAYVISGGTTGALDLDTDGVRITGVGGSEFGSALGHGDFDGDGTSDVIVGARYADDAGADSGTVYIFSGPITGDLTISDADAAFTGEADGDQLGNFASVASAGDTDGDGRDDVILGARETDAGGYRRGAAYVLVGPFPASSTAVSTAYAIFQGEADSDLVGDSVDGVGDVDGNGSNDVFIGSGFVDAGTSNGGAGYLVLGPMTGGTQSLTTANARFTAEDDNDRVRIQAGGDIDDDGYMDLLIGAQNNSDTGSQAGAVYLFYGEGL